MSIYDYETASAYGALDTAAVTSGTPFSAHLLRALAMSGNELTLKGEQLLQLIWPTSDTGEFSGSPCELSAGPYWERLGGGTYMAPKRRGLNRASARVYAKITSGRLVHMQFGTRARPLDFGSPLQTENTVALLGTGAWKVYTVSGLTISENELEEFDVAFIGDEPTGKASTTGPGSPNSGAFTSLDVDRLIYSSGTWNDHTGTNWADVGTWLSLEDSAGVRAVDPREVTIVVSSTQLYFDPPLTPGELALATAGGYFALYEKVDLDLANIVVAADARTF